MANENAIRNLIRIDDKENPTLFRALQLMVDDLYKINSVVFPPTPVDGDQTGPGAGLLPAVSNFTGIAYPDNLRLDWDNLTGAFRYSIKMGDDWDTARHILITATDMANVDPVYLNLVYGTYTFIIRAMDVNGVLGLPAFAQLTIPTIGPPDLSVEAIVSTVLLRWTVPDSAWRIDHYIIYKNDLPIGTIRGTFDLIQEQVGGTYSYAVAAVDIVGNIGTRSAVKTITLHDPSEFAFVADIKAEFDGVYVRTVFTVLDGIEGVLGPIPVDTWQQHYVFFGYDNAQEQIDAGYPLYYQPTYVGDGTYEEVFDFGVIHKNLKVVVDYSKLQIFGSTNVNTSISSSEDGITYTTPIVGDSLLVASFRYIKIIWTFTNVDDKSVAFISNMHVVLSVTLTLDSGSIDALASDVGGTLVTYNKIFTGINSVTATPAVSLQPLYSVCDDITKDNFRVLVFSSSGQRQNANISWKARGII